MQKEALVIIDIQNDITKNYKEVVGNINQAITGRSLITFLLFTSDMKIYQPAPERLNLIHMGLN